MTNGAVTNRLRDLWEQYASRYDRDTSFYDLFLLGDSRTWACSQASGQVLEVAIGTGRNLPFYPPGNPADGNRLQSSHARYSPRQGRRARH
jgi:hypothetical protein